MTFINSLLAAHSDSKKYYNHDRIEYVLRNRYNLPMYEVMNWADDCGDPEIEYSGFDLDKATEAMNRADRIADFEHKAQTWFIRSIDAEGEVIDDCIDSVLIPAINAETDAILSEVKDYFGGKYTCHETEGGNTIKLRIADHSGKHINNRGEKCISIVIAEKNVTEKFICGPEGISNEHYFDSTFTAQDIIEEIKELLK